MSGGSSPKLRKKPSIRKRYQGLKKNLIRGFLVFLLVSVLGFVIWYIRSIMFYNSNDIITKVIFHEDSTSFVSTGVWYDSAKDSIYGLYRRPLLGRQKNDIKNEISSAYDLITSVEITAENNTAYIYYVFDQPYLSVTTHDKSQHWIVDNNKLRKVENRNGVLKNTVELLLPEYLEVDSDQSIQGMFFSTHSTTLEQIIQKILDILFVGDIDSFTFVPGGEKLIIQYLNKQLIFHLDKSIDAQLAKIVDISNFFDKYESVQKIDLGSSDDIIVK